MSEQDSGSGSPTTQALILRRIQRKRTKGWRMPADAVYVGRPTKWGNPFRESAHTTRAWALAAFVEFINEHEQGWALTEAAKAELRGKHLVCWCSRDQLCHADVLMEIANG